MPVRDIQNDSVPRSAPPCACGESGLFRCLLCLTSGGLMCAAYLVAAHLRRPLHHIQKWEGFFFSECELRELGLAVYLGHAGQVCPRAKDPACWRVAADNAIHHVDLVFCGCDTSCGIDTELGEMGWMRLLDPETCGTARILRLHLNELSELSGSTLENPWYLEDSGALVLQAGRASHVRRVLPAENGRQTNQLRINKGPPSTIPRDLARPGAAAVHRAASGVAGPSGLTPGLAREVTEAIRSLSRPEPNAGEPRPEEVAHRRERRAREARDQRERLAYTALHPHVPVARARIGTRMRRRLAAEGDTGTRAVRDHPLTEQDLYLDAARPELLEARQPHHKCGICFAVKSHPVSYKCGHSHCYACIRIWLEKRWTCPDCVTVMTCAPFRHFGEENGLAADYPGRQDQSRVSYSFAEVMWLCRALFVVLSLATMSGSGRKGGGRPPPPPRMYTHQPHTAEVVSVSADGRRANATSKAVDTQPGVPSYYQDDAATNAAVESGDFSYNLSDTGLFPEVQLPENDGIILTSSKRKVYENSDYPMKTWETHMDEYLDEMLRLEGRGFPAVYSHCGGCGAADPKFRCAHQTCYGVGLFCQECIVGRHSEWTGDFFKRRSLQSLGLIVQLGHLPGYGCPSASEAHTNFVLIDVTGVHSIHLRFCGCDGTVQHRQQLMRACWWPATARDPRTCATFAVVRLFQILNCQGKLLTNNDGLDPVPDRRRAFRHIVRQYRIIQMMKRAGRGHDPSALLNTIIFFLILSYDLACQYCKNLWTRMSGLPQDMHLNIDKARVWFKIPNFHVAGHERGCHSPYSFHYMWGAGRTHGETVEQNWEFTNGAAASTKMMGVGSRHSTLEDLFGFHNWRRLVAWRRIFTKRMGENVKEGQVHRDAFEAFDVALRAAAPEMVAGWEAWVGEWESRQHVDGTESPFEVKEQVMSMKEILLKLAKEELVRNGEGVEAEHEDTPSTFILMGLGIEDSQRYLAIDVKAIANPTDKQALDFVKRRTALIKRIRAFRKMQRTYMPNVRRFLTPSQREVWDTEPDREAEAIRLFMPSDIADKVKRTKACAAGLADVEGELRVGEAREALEALRQGLHAWTLTNRFRLRNCTGQHALTRGQGVLRQINMRIYKAKLRYRYARNAVSCLKGHSGWERELHQSR
ncbi:hypothetical protein B0H11DRAFT_1914569 [Mycena galericulata]|nr:hypothetical protein B0H11DRAFT_1914569 [Mycena galericulata]